MATKLGRMMTYLEGFLTIKPPGALITWSYVKNYKTYLYYHNTYDQHASHDGDIQWGPPTYKVAWSFNHVVLWGHLTYLMFHIFNCTRPMATKNGKVRTYSERFLHLKPQDPLGTWDEVAWQFEKFISPHLQELWPLNLEGCWRCGEVSYVITNFLLYWYLLKNQRLKSFFDKTTLSGFTMKDFTITKT